MRPKSQLAAFSEKRSLHRARRSRPAHCVFNEGTSVLDVVLRDISPRGTRIAGAQVVGLPQTFELRIPDGLGGYSARRALVVWSKGAAAGLTFIDET
jgi:PilZ domain